MSSSAGAPSATCATSARLTGGASSARSSKRWARTHCQPMLMIVLSAVVRHGAAFASASCASCSGR